MEKYIEKLKASGFQGDIATDIETREAFSHDASLFEMMPTVVVAPKDSTDLQLLVTITNESRVEIPGLSLTARSAGTDMSGGAINDSVVVDFKKYFTNIGEVTAEFARTQPGVFFRDFDKLTIEKGSILPSYPASRDLCTIGGMVNNNSGGEKSLQYGKTANYVTELKMVLADGKEYTLKPLNKKELDSKMAQKDFEGKLYKDLFELIEKNYEKIKAAKPKVSKDSTGYHLWEVWDRETGIFDITKAVVGAQGTLGLTTEASVKLVPKPAHSGILVCYFKDISRLGEIINEVLAQKPATFESFDDNTLRLSFKFFPAFIKTLGFRRWVMLAIQLIPDFFMLFRGIPKLILMIEFTGDTPEEVKQKIRHMRKTLEPHYKMAMEENETEYQAEKFWIMRRQSFNLLRSKVKDKHTAPFIDDLVIPPQHLPEAWPRLREIIKKYKLLATIAGHMGDGNFHIIPLMKIEEPSERAKLQPAMKEVNELVLSYGGSLSGEHNDGMIRGPWLEQMYGKEMVGIFRQTKAIFDPNNIFNPHKKVDANWEFSMAHIREHF